MPNTENNYTETDLGNISLNPRGEYDSSAEYEYLDTVSYQGGSYFCLAELETTITGIAPDVGHNSEHWQMIAAPGDMTPEYTTAYNDVINKAVQVESSRAAVELVQQEIETSQADVQELHSDTVQVAQEAKNSKNSAANSAQSAEQSKNAASESEQNINGQIAGFDSRVSEAVEQSKEEINTTKQQVINAITNQQTASVNAVKTEGEKIITRVGNDAKTVADDRATVEEATQTVLNNAQEVVRNTQTVASNTEKAAASAEGAKTSADNAAQSAKSVEDASKQIEQNKKDVGSLKEEKIDKPSTSDNGKTPRAKNGNVEWVEQGLPSDAQTETAVNDWLNKHPEATTTVQDESITESKFAVSLREKKANYYKTVSEMKSDTSLKEGMTAITLGYYEANDGGGATYLIRSNKSSNDITILSLASKNVCAEIQISEAGIYNALSLGIKRNANEDMTGKINSVLKIMYNDTLYFPKGVYNVTSLLIPNPMTILGIDSASYNGIYAVTNTGTNEKTIFKYCGTGNETMITEFQSVKILIDGITFYGDSITYSHDVDIAPQIGVGTSQNTERISLKNVNGIECQGGTIEHCRFYKFSGYGIKINSLTSARNCTFDQCNIAIHVIWDCIVNDIIIGAGRTGILCKKDSNTVSCGANIINNIRCDGLMGYAIEFVGSIRNVVANLVVDQIDKAGICINDSSSNSFVNCNLNRTAKFYAGSSKADLPAETSGFASAIYFCGNVCNSNIIEAEIYQERFDDNETHKEILSPSLFVVTEAGFTSKNCVKIVSDQLSTYNEIESNVVNFISGFNSKSFFYTDLFIINSFNLIQQIDAWSGILDINGCIVKSLFEPKYIDPFYPGQRFLYNKKYYIATDKTKNDWKEINLIN